MSEQQGQDALDVARRFIDALFESGGGPPTDEPARTLCRRASEFAHEVVRLAGCVAALQEERDQLWEAVGVKNRDIDAAMADTKEAEARLAVLTEERDEARAIVEQLRRHGGDWIVEAAEARVGVLEAALRERDRLFDNGIQVALAAELRRRMEAAQVRQRDVAIVLGISEKHMSQMLTGRSQGSLEMWDKAFAAMRPVGGSDRG